MRITAPRLLVMSVAVVLLSLSHASADPIDLSLDTAYCFNGHAAPCDGGLAKVTNHGTDAIHIDSIVASGWLSGHTDDITSEGNQTIAGGGSSVFNSFLTGAGDDTSNDGAVADPAKGIIFTIRATDLVDSNAATLTFFDNAHSGYSFVDGPTVALTGADCDLVTCGAKGFVTDPTTPFGNPVPEPMSLFVLGLGLTGVTGMAWRRRAS